MNISQIQRTFVANKEAEIVALKAIIQRIKDALGTQEDGEALIEVARNAHRAEMELAHMIDEGA